MQETQELKLRKNVILLLIENNRKDLTELIESMTSKEIVHLIGHLNRDDQMQLLTLLSH